MGQHTSTARLAPQPAQTAPETQHQNPIDSAGEPCDASAKPAQPPDQLVLPRLLAVVGPQRVPPERALWRIVVDFTMGRVKAFTVENPPRRTLTGRVITCKPRLIPAHFVLLVAYHVYMLSNSSGEAGDDDRRWSVPTMAHACRISPRYLADALTVGVALRLWKRVHDSNRRPDRYLLNPGGMTIQALRERVKAHAAETPSTSQRDVLSTSQRDVLMGSSTKGSDVQPAQAQLLVVGERGSEIGDPDPPSAPSTVVRARELTDAADRITTPMHHDLPPTTTTNDDDTLPAYYRPQPPPPVDDPEIATDRQVRKMRLLARKLVSTGRLREEWPSEADAQAMSREKADYTIKALEEAERGRGFSRAVATKKRRAPAPARRATCTHTKTDTDHLGGLYCTACGATVP